MNHPAVYKQSSRGRITFQIFIALFALLSVVAVGLIKALNSRDQKIEKVPSPKSVLGYEIGEEGHLTSYDHILKYFRMVDESSERVKVVEVGRSTEGRPMVMAIVTSAENHLNLDHYKAIIKKLADPKKTTREESNRLASEGKPIVLIEPNIHSAEVSTGETPMAFLYKLASSEDAEVRRILDKTIVLILATQNPDGHDMQCDWYNKYKGTKFEGLPHTASPPNYHKYLGHDNNRDFVQFEIVESRNLANIINEWLPTIHHGMHQTGWYGERIAFLPHGTWPLGYESHPTLLAEWIMLGGHVFTDMAAKGLTGYYCTGYRGFAYHPHGTIGYSIPHGATGSMDETAGTWGASSVFIDPEKLPKEFKTKNWYHWAPWPGGKWSMKDAITYELITLSSMVSCVANYPEKFLSNFALRLRDQYERGLHEPPYAFVFPALSGQKDPCTAAKLLNKFIWGLVEVHVANKPFVADGAEYPAGSFVILMAQPFRFWPKYLLEVQGDPPLERPYSVTAWTQGYMMGVDVIQIEKKFSADLAPVQNVLPPAGSVEKEAKYAYIFSHAMNNATIAINRLLKKGYEVYLAAERFKDAVEWPEGTVIVLAKPGLHNDMKELATDLFLKVSALDKVPDIRAYQVKIPKIGLYLPLVGGKANMEEGHTRLRLEEAEFPFSQVPDSEIIKGNLKEKYDVFIMADGNSKLFYAGPPQPHPLASRGLGDEGAKSLREFVEKGGTFIGNGDGGLFPIDYFGTDLGVKKAVMKDIWCPGSILRIKLQNTHPIGYGMQPEEAAFFWNSPAFEVTTADAVARYSDKELLMSGSIKGEDKLYNKGAIVDARFGDGRLVFLGFSVLQGGQADGTFKLFFNSIHYGGAELGKLPQRK